ncbi:Hydroxyethylthiazole kinase [Fructilactobacillus florum 8D]|uniref:Hydroxyethylthiazole kinase n=2 Tax=Fructilactobacillus florum TaxID=640331 RepID=W9ELV2_9LACO|nr:hydroxyethylthiazole kinase [Fructilactobacillus florum]ETO40664.1 Hydroxyethylthiazole kinase [Fructilactobacillus florum 8D]KRM92302.1 hydroxyethylthiazole kinase [Fructilactobacillus florum DSM 22689 = JCM 16035]
MTSNLIAQIRQHNPIVLNIANQVTPQRVADGINFLGGSPMMVSDPLEVAELAKLAQAVTLNLGSTSPTAQLDMLTAGRSANQHQLPVVFDPVAVGASSVRTERTQQLLQQVKVDTIRGNAAEIAQLAGIAWQIHGIDAGAGEVKVSTIAKQAAQKLRCRVVLSGAHDIITDGVNGYEVHNDVSLLATNVGMGDVLDGILATAISQATSLYDLALATGILPVAAERALVKTGTRPASFLVETYNQLAALDDTQLDDRLQLSTI